MEGRTGVTRPTNPPQSIDSAYVYIHIAKYIYRSKASHDNLIAVCVCVCVCRFKPVPAVAQLHSLHDELSDSLPRTKDADIVTAHGRLQTIATPASTTPVPRQFLYSQWCV